MEGTSRSRARRFKVLAVVVAGLFFVPILGAQPAQAFHDEVACPTILGTGNNETLTGTGGCNHIIAREGSDTIFGLGGDDVIEGGQGNDTISGGDGNDVIMGGDRCPSPIQQIEIAIIGLLPAALGALAPVLDDVVLVVCLVTDSLTTFAHETGNDVIFGDAGSDCIEGGLGNDYLSGGADGDLVSGGQLTGAPAAAGALPGGFTCAGMFSPSGGPALNLPADGNDYIEGNGGDDFLQGREGNDAITGGAGNDMQDGGPGVDSCETFAVGDAVQPVNCES